MRSRASVTVVAAVALLLGCTSTQDREQTAPAGEESSSSTAEAAAVDPIDTAAVTRELDFTFGGPDPIYPTVMSVLVSQGGELLIERYYDKDGRDSHDIASVTKSVVSTLVGIAVDDGRLTLDQPLRELLPAYASSMSDEVAGLTLEQLLTMTAGLPADPDPLHGGGPLPFTASDDWVGRILEDGPSSAPDDFAYSSASSHLLSAILTEATGLPLLEYAEDELFAPLGIDTRGAITPMLEENSRAYHRAYDRAPIAWSVDPAGLQTGWGYLKLRPREMLRLGQLVLQDGVWNGNTVVSRDWVEDATTNKLDVLDTDGVGYGYQWFTTEAGGRPAALAVGFGGQLIEVVPEQDLVVVTTSEIVVPPVLDGGDLTEAVNEAVFSPR